MAFGLLKGLGFRSSDLNSDFKASVTASVRQCAKSIEVWPDIMSETRQSDPVQRNQFDSLHDASAEVHVFERFVSRSSEVGHGHSAVIEAT